MSFLYGVLGTVAVLALFALGVFAGWKLRQADETRKGQKTAKELTEQERRWLEDQQNAFRELQNYNAERAYNIKSSGLGDEQT